MSALGRITKNFTNDQRGVAMIEMAVVLPVLLAIGLGVMEFGNAIYSKHLITNGVRDAARYAAGLQKGTADTAARNIAIWGTTTTTDTCNTSSTSAMKLSRRVSWWCDANTVAITYPCFDNDKVVAFCLANTISPGNKIYRGGDSITMVTVTATVPYQQLGFLSYFGLNAPTLSVSHEERVFSVR